MKNGDAVHDVVVLGAGPAGLSAAAEIAKKGLGVVVLEEHQEIGQPEKCTGIVSRDGLKRVFPEAIEETVIREVDFGRLFIEDLAWDYQFDRGKVTVLDRARLDRKLAALAVDAGAELMLSTRANWIEKDNGVWRVYTRAGVIGAKMMIDARGIGAYRGRKLSAMQLIVRVRGDFYEGFVVYVNKKVSSSGFAWYAPLDDGIAKVGAIGMAGELEQLLQGAIKASGLTVAPLGVSSSAVAIGGPVYSDDDDLILAGDAGGQVKPLTAGGIITGALGGIMAAEAVNKGAGFYRSLYDKEIGGELEAQVRLRELFESINNGALVKLVKALPSDQPLFMGDEFDSHTKILARALRSPSFYFALLEVAPRYIFDRLKRSVANAGQGS